MAAQQQKPFKLGDLVQLVTRRGGRPNVGDVGIVAEVYPISNGRYAYHVDFVSQSRYGVTHYDIKPVTLGGGPSQTANNQLKGTPSMPAKFNVGDRVIWKISSGDDAGDHEGTVKLGPKNGEYAVEFDEQFNRNLHNCDGATADKMGWWVETAELHVLPKRAPVSFESVVLEDSKRQQIIEALEQINKQELIFKTWGFEKTIEKGRGMSMLFYGPPGTGKTLMGQALADKMDSKLKVISTADIETSEPGGAERAIRKIFKECTKRDIILFDECDSLIFSRENTGPILAAQVNQLLTSIEKHEGITIFTTNRLGHLDEAVNRRLALKLEFAMPDQAARSEIFKRMFPPEAPLHKDVDFFKLAVVEMTGGYIKNAVLRAVRMAASDMTIEDKDKQITQTHLVTAVKLEAESMAEFERIKDDQEQKTTPWRAVGGGLGVGGGGKLGRTVELKKVMEATEEAQ